MKTNKLESYSILPLSLILGSFTITPAFSQPIIPANDGTGTTVTPQGNQFNIEGGARNGVNLFHSFDQFNINSGQTANFLTTPDTRNILGRVTGGNASIINGLIQVTGGNSNLFLINPAGIMFGPNASLNIPASFSVTTATGIGFDNNNYWFNAMGTNDYSNLVGKPSGYRFDVSNPGAIVNQGNLSLNPGENLTLLGGTVINTGQLSTAGGNITIAAVEGSSTLRISQPGHLLSLEVGATTANGEDISGITPLLLPELLTGGEVTQATSMTVNGNGDVVLIDSNTLVADVSGTAITTGSIDVSTTSTLGKGSNIGGQVNVLGDRVALIDTNINADGLNRGGTVLIGGDFQGNGIVPNSQQTFVNQNSIISADATTNGDGGQVIIWSDGITNFAGNISATGGEFSGDGGFVEVSGKQQLIFDGNVDVSAAFGTPGTILLDPENIIVGESENTESSETETVDNNSEVASGEDTDSPTTENTESSETEIVDNNSEVVSGENTDAPTTENTESSETETVDNNSEVVSAENIEENVDNSELTENTNSETEIADNSETTETPIDPFEPEENSIDVTISAENIGELSGDIILFADNDITINEKIETTESVELKAGRSININADIDTSMGNGNIDLLGNNDEMNIANRNAGAASINQLDGTTLNAGSSRINIELGNLGEVGDINLANLTTTGEVLVNANGGNITRVSDSSIINAGNVLFQTNGSGGIGLIDAPLRLNVENLEAVSGSGGAFFDVGNVNIGDVSENVDGIVTAGGDIDIKSEGNVTLTETISTIETVENNSEAEISPPSQGGLGGIEAVGATENTEVADTSGSINIEATGDIVATGSGIKGGGESVSLSATNITINDEFEETSGDADINLEATNDITVEDIEDDVLEFFPGGGEIEFRADVDGNGVGIVEMLDNEVDVGSDPNTFENGADTIKTNGRSLTIAGASITLGNVDTSGLPIYSGGELLAAIDVDEGGPIPPELEDKSGLIPEEDVDFSDIEFDENFNYIINGESYYFAEIEGGYYYVPTTLNDTATFTFTVDGNLANVENLDVRFSAAHTNNSDLQVYLISPQGQEVILFAGGFGQNFQDTVLDDDASTNIGSGNAPFDGTYSPQGSLARFNGENPNGIWTLRVTDTFPEFSSGTLYRAGDAAPWGSATGTQLLLRNPTTLVSSGGNGGAINLEATRGDINVGNIRSLSESADGGRIDLKANNNIITGLINSSSLQGIGGDINLNAVSGNILTYSLDTSSFDGDGGEITISAQNGDINTESLDSIGFNGDGGEITISAQSGDINTESLYSSGYNGDGGEITISAQNGDINTGSLDSSGFNGNGGEITISSQDGDINTESLYSREFNGNGGEITISSQNGDINTESLYSDGGEIAISSQSGDINTESLYSDGGDITTSAQGDINATLIHSYGGDITISAQGNINTGALHSRRSNGGGDITISSQSGDINTEWLYSSSSEGNGGNITISSQSGDINTGSLNSSARSLDSSGVNGNGGDITISSQNGDINTGSLNSSGANGNGGDITISSQSGDINTEWLYSSGFVGITISIGPVREYMGTNGGEITISAQNGDINTTSLRTRGLNGGDITIFAQSGDINTTSLDSTGLNGNGGDITIFAQSGNINTTSLDSFSYSHVFSDNSENGGAISLTAETIKFNPPEDGDTQQLAIRTFSVGENGSGKGGDVNITSNNLTNTEILTLSSHGNSGEVTIESQPQGNLELNDLSIITSKQVTIEIFEEIQIDVGATEGQSGNVNIFSSDNLNLNNVTIESDTKSDQPAGNVNITSLGNITLDNTEILSITNGQGNAGEISLEATQNILLTNNSRLLASTESTGNAGSINIQANNLNLDQNTSLITETTSAGNPGSINIQANTVDIGQDAQISATVLIGSTSNGDGGNITINTNELNITGKLGIFAETEASANAGILTLSPYKDNPDLDINFSNDGFISASTSSTGNGGNIFISAPENIDISGEGFIAVETSGTGNAGIIDIQTDNLRISDGVAISASTEDKGNAGQININTKNFTLEKGTSLTTETNNQGQAGDIEITTEKLTIGENAQISATAREGATNTEAGGNITINANDLFISGRLGIFAETAGESPAGTLTLNPYRRGGDAETRRHGEGERGKIDSDLNITFTNEGFISARTTSTGDGGNINISAPESINISGEGRITVETEGAGNAGTINIETENLTVAENTTISAATSDSGDGGSINITPTQTFQLEGQILTETTGKGSGGNITINTGEMIAPNSTISAKSTDTGNAGTIEITAQENITTGIIQSSASLSQETADGGEITITSEQGKINATQPIQSFSEKGNAGDVTLTAKTDVTTNTISSHGEQQGGQITIITETGNIDTSNGFLANYSGEGTGGNVTLEASAGNITTSDIYSFADADGGQILLKAGGDINITENSNIISASEPPEEETRRGGDTEMGRGGNIILEAGNNINTTTARIYSGADIGDTGKIDIIADDAIETGQIDLASGFVRDRVTVNQNFTLIPLPQGEATQGTAGNITLNSNNGTIDTTGGTINSRSPDGSGDITLNARENITTGQLEANALNPNQPTTGGDVNITSQQGQINVTQAIETFSERGTAGNVNIKAEGSVNIENILSQGTQRGGDITIESRSENSINAQGELNTFSTEGIAGDVNITSPGSITINGIRSEGMEQGGTITVESEIGNINSGGDIDSFSDQGIGGNVTLNAPESVNLANVSSFGATESGDLVIQSSTAAVNTGNVTTQAPAGSSGSIIINGEEVGTGDLSSIGTTSAGEINVEATDGSITTYDIEISSDGTIGDLILRAPEDITTGDINQNAGEGDANINIESGEDQTTGDITQTAENDVNNVQVAEGDITTEDITQTAGNDANNVQIAEGNITTEDINQTAGNDANNVQIADGDLSTGDITQTAGNDANNIQVAEGDITTGDITQTAGNDTNNIQVAEGNITTGDITQTAGNDANNIQVAEGNITTGDITQTAGNDVNNIQVAEGNITTGDITQTAGNDVNNIQVAEGNITTGDITQTAGNDVNNIQLADGNQNIGNVTQTAGNDANNIQVADGNQNIGEVTQTFGNESINIQTQEINQNTDNTPVIPDNNNSIINQTFNQENPQTNNNANLLNNSPNNTPTNFVEINTSTITPSNNDQTTNTATAKEKTEESINNTTDTQQILEVIDTVNANPLTVATGSDQVVMMLEQNRTQEYSDYFGEDFNQQLLQTKNVRDILTDMAQKTGKESAVVYINAYPEQLQIILYTKSGEPIIKTIATVDRETLMEVVLELRANVTNPRRRHTDSYLPSAQQLYDWLIAPISAELKAANIDTLLFSMDRGLRTLPVAALHDGEQFLIEKYSLSFIPSVSLMDTNYRPLQDTRVLAMGASEFVEQNPLPAVPVELENIAQRLWPGDMFLNEDFTFDNLVVQRESYPYPIIHLATHADFRPGKAGNSYIQLWGSEKIRLDQMRELGWNEPAVELLVLSACRTAFGDRNAELGFAGLAVGAGVKSALATVWYVNDEGTLGLMTEFYTHLNDTKIKAEALRQAQLAMLRGDVVIADGELRGSGSRGVVVLPPVLENIENDNLSHPYYWAGFTMVGSPW